MSAKAAKKKVIKNKKAIVAKAKLVEAKGESKTLVKAKEKKRGRKPAEITETKAYETLVDECKRLMEHTEQTMILNYWKLGHLVNKLRGAQRATYGNKTVLYLSEDLGKDPTTLYRAGKFADIYREKELVPRGSNLTWGHMKAILAVEDLNKREELREKVEKENISIKTLIAEIQGPTHGKTKALKSSSLDSFFQRATTFYNFITETQIDDLDASKINKSQVKELEELYKKIGDILKRLK